MWSCGLCIHEIGALVISGRFGINHQVASWPPSPLSQRLLLAVLTSNATWPVAAADSHSFLFFLSRAFLAPPFSLLSPVLHFQVFE